MTTSDLPGLVLNRNCHCVAYSEQQSNISCSSLVDSATSTISSAYRRMPTCRSKTQTPKLRSFRVIANPLMYMAYSSGDNTAPCGSPTVLSNSELALPCTTTVRLLASSMP